MSHLQKSLKLLLLVILFSVVSSCKQNKSSLAEYGSVFEKVVISDQGVFRGFSLGDSLKNIKAKEKETPKEEDENYLYYEYKSDSLTTFNVSYSFDEKGLNEIKSDIFVKNNMDVAEDIYNKFKEYFNQHYGQSETEGGFDVWSVKSEKYGEIRIDLSNEFPAFNTTNAIGKISLWIYPDTN